MVTVCAGICVWSHTSHHGQITKTTLVFKDFFNGRGHCTETGGDNKFQSRDGNVWKEPEKASKTGVKEMPFLIATEDGDQMI